MINFFNKTIPSQFHLPIVCLIILSPLIFLIFGTSWLYPLPHIGDSYYAYVFTFSYDVKDFHDYFYKGARLPWIVPLFYIQKFFGPFIISPLINILGLVSLSSLFFLWLKQLFGTRPAILILPWIAFYPHLVGIYTGGGTYHNIISTIYFLIALIFWGSKNRTNLKLIITGIFLANTLHCSSVHLNLLLIFPFLDYLRERPFKLSNYYKLIAGFILGTLFWCLINFLHDRPFWFFLTHLEVLLMLVDTKVHHVYPNPWIRFFFLNHTNDFYRYGYYLSSYVSCFIVSIWAYYFYFKQKMKDAFSSSAFFFAYFLLWIFWNQFHFPSLRMPDFTYPLQPILFLMIASWIKDRPLKTFEVFLIGLVILANLFSGYFAVDWQKFMYRPYPYYSLMVILIFVIGLILSFFINWKKKILQIIGALLITASYGLTTVDMKNDSRPECLLNKNAHDIILGISQKIKEIEPNANIVQTYSNYQDRVFFNPKNTCMYYPRIYLDDLVYYTQSVIGPRFAMSENLEDPKKSLPLDQLEANHFMHIYFNKGLLVLFPSTTQFAQDFESRAQELGMELDLKNSSRANK
jgi:hypothetical protein